MFGLERWVKRKLRPIMTPIPQAHARRMVKSLSLLYAFLGWNIVTVLIYLTYNVHIPEGPDKIQKLAEILDIEQAEVVTLSGINKVSEYEIDRRPEIPKPIIKKEVKKKNLTSEDYKRMNDELLPVDFSKYFK